MTLQELYQQALEAKATNQDLITPLGDWKYCAGPGRLASMQTEEDPPIYKLNNWALSQLCQRVKCQLSYIRRCPDWLQETNLNYWMQRYPFGPRGKEEVLLRLQGDTIRAVLSNRYGICDDDELLEIMLQDNNVVNQLDLHSYSFSEISRIALVDKLGPLDILGPANEKFIVGMTMINSEVGRAPVKPVLALYRYYGDEIRNLCPFYTNAVFSGESFSRRHVYSNRSEFKNLIANMINQITLSVQPFTATAEQALLDSRQQLVNQMNPRTVRNFITRLRDNFGRKWVKENVEEPLEANPNLTQYELADMVSRMALQVKETEVSIRGGYIAGHILGLV